MTLEHETKNTLNSKTEDIEFNECKLQGFQLTHHLIMSTMNKRKIFESVFAPTSLVSLTPELG